MRVIGWAVAGWLAAGVATGAAWAEGERAGDFDYYVMALSWSANWCATTGDRRDDPQCDAGRGIDFVLHGLWPQYEDGWPSFCRTAERDPPRSLTAAQADLFGGAGAAFYQWKKHGRCAGLPATDYFRTARAAFDSITIPEVFTRLNRDIRLPADVVEEAFLDANPALSAEDLLVTCRDGMVQEVRICLTRDLDLRACNADVGRVCRGTVGMEAVR